MRFTHATAIAAYILSSSELVAAAPPIVKDVYHTAADVSKLGDLTFKVQQKANPHFRTFGGRGAMAKARALRKYGVPIPNDLREVVDRIVQRHGGPIRSDQQEGATAESDLGDDKGKLTHQKSNIDLYVQDISYLTLTRRDIRPPRALRPRVPLPGPDRHACSNPYA